MLGKPASEIEKMSRKGKLTSKVMTKVFEKMTSEGGIFYKGMEIASETLTGKVSTLKDNIGSVAIEIGKVLAPTLKDSTDYLIGLAKKTKEWIVQNKALIQSKFDSFIKQIPYYYEKIVYWGPKILKGIAVFYALTAAIKTVNAALAIANALAKINLTPWRKFSTVVKGPVTGSITGMNKEIEKSITKTDRLVSSAAGIATAFAAGYGAGKLLNDAIIEPHSQKQSKKFRGAESLSTRITGRESMSEISSEISRVDRAMADVLESQFSAENLAGSFASLFTDVESPVARQQRVLSDLGKQRSKLRGRWLQMANTGLQDASGMVSRSESVKKEQVEITIKDETGRARITKGRNGGGLNLAHTGGMP